MQVVDSNSKIVDGTGKVLAEGTATLELDSQGQTWSGYFEMKVGHRLDPNIGGNLKLILSTGYSGMFGWTNMNPVTGDFRFNGSGPISK